MWDLIISVLDHCLFFYSIYDNAVLLCFKVCQKI